MSHILINYIALGFGFSLQQNFLAKNFNILFCKYYSNAKQTKTLSAIAWNEHRKIEKFKLSKELVKKQYFFL